MCSLPLRAPHIIGVKTKQKINKHFKKLKIMKITVKGGGALALRQVSLGAAAIQAALNGKATGIKFTFTDDTSVSASEQPMPGDVMRGIAASKAVVATMANVTIEGLDGIRTINCNRVLAMLAPGAADVDDAVKIINEKGFKGFTADIETLENYGGAKRFNNVIGTK